MSLDYFRIHLANAIGQIAPSTTIQSICEASGGASIYCANYQRPLPFSDHSIANFATKLITFNLNTASTETEGWDFETNYAWQMSDIVDSWKGSWNARLLATYQPIIQQIGAVHERAIHTLSGFKHPRRRFPELHGERLEPGVSGQLGFRASAKSAVPISCRGSPAAAPAETSTTGSIRMCIPEASRSCITSQLWRWMARIWLPISWSRTCSTLPSCAKYATAPSVRSIQPPRPVSTRVTASKAPWRPHLHPREPGHDL